MVQILEPWESYIITPLTKIMAHTGNGAAETCGLCEAGLLRCCLSIQENWHASRYSDTLSMKIELDDYESTTIGAQGIPSSILWDKTT